LVPTGVVELAGMATVPLGTEPEMVFGGAPGLDAGVGLQRGAEPGGHTGGSGRLAYAEGVFMGEGPSPLPSRLVEQIRRWEFIKMFEILPELLADQKGGDRGVKQTARIKGRKRVQEIGVWLHCFAVFVGGWPSLCLRWYVPALMAYMISIIRASQEYEGAMWVASLLPSDGRRQPWGNRTGQGLRPPCTQSASQGRPAIHRGLTAALE